MLNDEFDQHFRRTQKMVIGIGVFAAVLSVAGLAGIGWLVYVLLAHFGVIH